jgi:putative transposase
MKSGKKKHWAKTATFEICVSCKNYAGQWEKHGRRTLVYAFWGFRPGSTAWVRETYRRRFGIETSYRQMNEARLRMCSRNPCLRLLFFGLAMILRNAWVWFHIAIFARHYGRRVELHLEALPFEDLLLNLQRVAEAALGITQIIQSQTAAKEQLTNAC